MNATCSAMANTSAASTGTDALSRFLHHEAVCGECIELPVCMAAPVGSAFYVFYFMLSLYTVKPMNWGKKSIVRAACFAC